MESFLFSLNVILPLIIEMAIGFALRMCNIIDAKTSKAMIIEKHRTETSMFCSTIELSYQTFKKLIKETENSKHLH